MSRDEPGEYSKVRVLVVDEISMVDAEFLDWYMASVPRGVQLIFCGDFEQASGGAVPAATPRLLSPSCLLSPPCRPSPLSAATSSSLPPPLPFSSPPLPHRLPHRRSAAAPARARQARLVEQRGGAYGVLCVRCRRLHPQRILTGVAPSVRTAVPLRLRRSRAAQGQRRRVARRRGQGGPGGGRPTPGAWWLAGHVQEHALRPERDDGQVRLPERRVARRALPRAPPPHRPPHERAAAAQRAHRPARRRVRGPSTR